MSVGCEEYENNLWRPVNKYAGSDTCCCAYCKRKFTLTDGVWRPTEWIAENDARGVDRQGLYDKSID
jgi:hypothetical protein